MSREKKKRKGKTAILIFVEGETEEAYFNSLKKLHEATSVRVKLLKGTGDWIDKAKKQIKNNPNYKGYETINTFVIFDKNGDSKESLEKIFDKAEREGFKVGFSNHSIEVWLLAHFEQINKGFQPQSILEQKLSRYLGVPYKKGNVKQIDKIIQNVDKAIDNVTQVKMIDLEYQCTNVSELITTIWKIE